MQVFCSLPSHDLSPSLIQSLCKSDLRPILSSRNKSDLHSLYRSVVLARTGFQSVVLRMPFNAFVGDSSTLQLISSYGFKHLVISGWLGYSLEPFLNDVRTRGISLGIEILSVAELSSINPYLDSISSLFLKGHEASGIVGADHIHVLFHAVKARIDSQQPNIIVEGGIGINAAGILALQGSAGVVLTDQIKLACDYPQPLRLLGPVRRDAGAHETVAVQITKEYFLRIPRTFTGGLQQILEDKQSLFYPLQSVRTNPELLGQLLTEIFTHDIHLESCSLGQDYALAAQYSDRYGDICSIALAYRKSSSQLARDLSRILEHNLVCDSGFLSSYGVESDLLQGPMTRVSDTPQFIQAVADGGALSFFAAAMLEPPVLRKQLIATQTLLDSKPWGVGLLGFLPPELREKQFAVVKDIRPPFVLIAGGRPDQAVEFDSLGITPFLHAPTLDLFIQYIQDGATNIVLEGRECGGHVGPVGSLLLWEQCLNFLVNAELPSPNEAYHIVLAGGIADRATCTTARLLSGQAKLQGFHIGILTGTPYLYTDEAVATGAIIESYRETVIQSGQTSNLETGAGHASRCAVTPFTEEFEELKNQYIASGLRGYELREELEKLTLGRLRLATKGLKRVGSELISISDEEALREGMYMLGQSAVLLRNKTTINELHQTLRGETEIYMRSLLKSQSNEECSRPSPTQKVAIVAMDCIMPDSSTLNRFWEILFTGQDVIQEVSPERWDPNLYFSTDRTSTDHVYSKWGGFLPPISFDPIKLGIPPVSLKRIEPLQILTLELVRRLFDSSDIDFSQETRDRTSVFLGAGGGIGDMGGKYAARSEIERVALSGKEDIYSRLPEWGDETFPGLLFNVVAGRVANRLNLKGASHTVDAACASSLAAVYSAYRELTSYSCDLAIAGGVDTGQSPFAFLCFSRSQALSPTGRSRSFDQQADGIAISEGLGIVVLKRLEDAIADSNDIIAVIEGVGAASDGRGASLTLPQTSGQQLAVERAWQSAEQSPSSMSLYEAHGTGTVAGDKTELNTIVSVLTRYNAAAQSCAVSSTKPNIGHTKSSAGIAGLIHASLCIHSRSLSPQIGATSPLEALSDPNSPIYLNTTPSYWPRPLLGRKAGVSAFGFGGTNYHIALSEPPLSPRYLHAWQPLSSYLFIWQDDEYSQLVNRITEYAAFIGEQQLSLHLLAYQHWLNSDSSSSRPACCYRLAVVASSISELLESLSLVQVTPSPEQSIIQLDQRTYISFSEPKDSPQTVVFLFPGQGGLREDCLTEMSYSLEPIKNYLDLAVATGSLTTESLRMLLQKHSSMHYSPYDATQLASADLQTLICAYQLGVFDSLLMHGVHPDICIGHSLGELSATAASGVWSDVADFLRSIRQRGIAMDAASEANPSGMIATNLTDLTVLSDLIKDYPDTFVSNLNSPSQVTISTSLDNINSLATHLKRLGHKASVLRVSGGFHSPLMRAASDRFASLLHDVALRPPAVPVLSLVDGQFYGADTDKARHRLAAHMCESVRLNDSVKSLDSSPSIFVNIGPSLTLQKLVQEIRCNPEDIFVTLDDTSNQVGAFNKALAQLFCLSSKCTPNLGHYIPATYRKTAQRASSAPSATVTHGMAHLLSDSPYPSRLPPLTSDLTPQLQGNQHSSQGFTTATQHAQETSNQLPSLITMSSSPTYTLPTSQAQSIQARNSMTDPTSLQIYSQHNETLRQILHAHERITLQVLGLDLSTQGLLASPDPLLSRNTSTYPAGNGSVSDIDFLSLDFSPPDLAPLQHPERPPAQVNTQVSHLTDPGPLSNQPLNNRLSTSETVPFTENDDADATPDYQSLLISITSELTGYPPEMLETSLAFEADLGIDSIKRVEILGRLQRAVPDAYRESIKNRTEQLASAVTISDILAVLSDSAPATGKP